MKSTGIKVKIFNSDYSLQGENPEEVQKVAGYVDTIMHRINFESPNQSGETIAVVSALNIAENLFKEKKNSQEIENDFEDFVNICINRVDEMHSALDELL